MRDEQRVAEVERSNAKRRQEASEKHLADVTAKIGDNEGLSVRKGPCRDGFPTVIVEGEAVELLPEPYPTQFAERFKGNVVALLAEIAKQPWRLPGLTYFVGSFLKRSRLLEALAALEDPNLPAGQSP